ncbi:hypothetical protein [uncultured Hydrogenophaga sp.]|uniref:hypothetical protein n=1 Tax=uncultured Hydrogenophaga sp. TaxID=199683 RepID=UPI00265D689C|nr:hypothetical protein [uncultured Hydrogenophaga sp.]
MQPDRFASFSAACLATALLTACDQSAPEPAPGPPSGPAEYPVTSPPAPPAALPDQSTTDGTRKPAQTSPGVLVPGQNNDHSAPISPGR